MTDREEWLDKEWSEVFTELISNGTDPAGVHRHAVGKMVSPELVAEALRRSFQIWADLPEAQLPPFEQWDAIPPGKLDLRVFDQDIWWCDILRSPHRLTEMSDGHLLNVVMLIQQRAKSFCAGYHFMRVEEPSGDPMVWSRSTVLMQGLLAEIERRD